MLKYIEYINSQIYHNENMLKTYSEQHEYAKNAYGKCLNYYKVYPYVSSKFGEIGYNPCRLLAQEIRMLQESIDSQQKIILEKHKILDLCKNINEK